MLITIELTPGAEGWNLTITRPGREWSCDDVSGRRAVQAVTAEVEAAIDRATVEQQHQSDAQFAKEQR